MALRVTRSSTAPGDRQSQTQCWGAMELAVKSMHDKSSVDPAKGAARLFQLPHSMFRIARVLRHHQRTALGATAASTCIRPHQKPLSVTQPSWHSIKPYQSSILHLLHSNRSLATRLHPAAVAPLAAFNRPSDAAMSKRWLPLESNPEVISEFSERIGLDTSECGFYDIFGLDDELLMMVPQPVLAVFLLFPVTDEIEAAAKAGDEELKKQNSVISPSVYYMKQTIGNACGTIALLHGLGNNRDRLPIAEDSFLSKFFDATQGLDPQARGQYLEHPPAGGVDIEDAHQEFSKKGDTAPPPEDEEVNLHFICFVERDGKLYELDGRRAGPVPHGPTSPDTLLVDVAKVVKQFIEKTNSLQFNMIAMSTAQG